MRVLIILLLVTTSLASYGQKEINLKKKFFGKYKGEIPSYKMDTGDEIVDVGNTPIYIVIAKDQIAVRIGSNELTGTYDVMFEAKKYYLLDCKMQGQIATERILVYKRGKRLSRDGMFPQPVAELNKYK